MDFPDPFSDPYAYCGTKCSPKALLSEEEFRACVRSCVENLAEEYALKEAERYVP